MQRKPISDMVPRKKLEKPREAAIPKSREPRLAEKPRTEEKKQRYAETRYRETPREKRKMGMLSKAILCLLILGGAFFGIMSYFASAEVTVTRRSETVQLQADLAAFAGPGGDLAYKTMTIEKDATTTVPASLEQDVESEAAGTVVIYNAYSKYPYRLARNTRLESSGGLIFKISEAVVIPGEKIMNGTSTPGSVEAKVFADSAGPEYNVGYADFTLPGLKGSPAYSGYYARSKTAIAGGWSGKKSIPSDSDAAKAEASLQAQISSQLQAEALSEVPDGYILIPGLYATSFGAPEIGGSDGSATVSESGTFRGALFSKADITKMIIQKSGTKIGGPIEASGMETLEAAPKSDISQVLSDNGPIAFSLKGSPVVSATIDTSLLQKALAGSPRSSLGDILKGFPGISSASVSIIPFWESSFPSDAEKTKVVVQ